MIIYNLALIFVVMPETKKKVSLKPNTQNTRLYDLTTNLSSSELSDNETYVADNITNTPELLDNETYVEDKMPVFIQSVMKYESKDNITLFTPFDIKNFPSLYIVVKNNRYYLYDIIRQDFVYTFPMEGIVFRNDIVQTTISKNCFYDEETQILTFATNNENKQINIENVQLTYNGGIFKYERINTFSKTVTSQYNIVKLPNTNNIMLYWHSPVASIEVIILDSYTLSIINVFSNTYINNSDGIMFRKDCVIALRQTNDILFYNFVDNKEIMKVYSKNTSAVTVINTGNSNKNVIAINNNETINIYSLMDKDEIPVDKRCMICSGYTNKNQIIVPCGHRQFCTDCIGKFYQCPMCAKKIEKVIDIQ